MRTALIEINKMLRKGIFSGYAIGGSVATLFYVEPTVTYDLDVIVNIPNSANLDPLREIFNWASDNNFPISGEHIIINGLPVQFLPAYNPLIIESLKKSLAMDYEGVSTNVIAPEYLVAIMIQTFRPVDKERASRFINDYKPLDLNRLEVICREYGIIEKYNKIMALRNER